MITVYGFRNGGNLATHTLLHDQYTRKVVCGFTQVYGWLRVWSSVYFVLALGAHGCANGRVSGGWLVIGGLHHDGGCVVQIFLNRRGIIH